MSNNFLAGSQVQSVEGMYRLGALVQQSASGSIYETEFGDDARPAIIKIRRMEALDSGPMLARWEGAIALSHTHLLRVFAAGRSVIDDVAVAYVVMERADESLAEVLAERTLSETETREMLIPVLAALRYLHKKGYAHSNLRPSNILAMGDVLKLSTDYIIAFQDGGSPAEDMRALGVVVVQAFTREAPKIDEYSGSYILREASQTFTDIVRHCLEPDPEKRWTVDQVQARLDAQTAAPISRPVPEVRSRTEVRLETEQPRRAPKWIYGVLAALILMVIIVGLMRKKSPAPPAAVVQPPVNQVVPVPAPPASETAHPQAEESRPPAKSILREREKTAPSGARGRRSDGWSVIAAAYAAHDPAERRNKELAKRWPNFNWGVLRQQGTKTVYLVVLGSNLPEDEAEATRERAVAAGLPHDIYIKRLP